MISFSTWYCYCIVQAGKSSQICTLVLIPGMHLVQTRVIVLKSYPLHCATNVHHCHFIFVTILVLENGIDVLSLIPLWTNLSVVLFTITWVDL